MRKNEIYGLLHVMTASIKELLSCKQFRLFFKLGDYCYFHQEKCLDGPNKSLQTTATGISVPPKNT